MPHRTSALQPRKEGSWQKSSRVTHASADSHTCDCGARLRLALSSAVLPALLALAVVATPHSDIAPLRMSVCVAARLPKPRAGTGAARTGAGEEVLCGGACVRREGLCGLREAAAPMSEEGMRLGLMGGCGLVGRGLRFSGDPLISQ